MEFVNTPFGWETAEVEPAETMKGKRSFNPDRYDFLLALTALALGYLFSRWVLFSWRGWGVAVFTTAYLLAVTAYMMKKRVFSGCSAAWFWMSATWLTGMSYALWQNAGFGMVRAVFLFCCAVYFVTMASGCTFLGKTSNYLPIDGLNTVIVIPFRNFLNQYLSFAVYRKNGRGKGKCQSVIAGVAIALILLAMLIPMLMRADSGGFRMLLRFISRIFLNAGAWELILYGVIALPIAAYLHGLVSGAAHNRGTDAIKPEKAEKTVASMRVLQTATVFIVLGAVCGLYLLFILSQIPYFFSAFSGSRPEDWLVYSDYARHGFFELCGIAAINLSIITACNVFCKSKRIQSDLLRVFNCAIAVITLVLIATAFSKMALYIGVYGLTMPRLLPCMFMIFLTIVFIALIALQKWDFSIVRLALASGAIILCVLSLSNPNSLIVRYNTDRYLRGTLQDYDVEILRRAGSAGVLSAIEVYEQTMDERLKEEIVRYLLQERNALESMRTHEQSFESHRANERLYGFSHED